MIGAIWAQAGRIAHPAQPTNTAQRTNTAQPASTGASPRTPPAGTERSPHTPPANARPVIGADGTMAWNLPEDLAHFKATTMGTHVLMGRRTWDSLPARFRPLPGRTNWVASRSTSDFPGAQTVADIDGFLADPRWQHDDLWVIGGGQIYQAALPWLNRAVVTEIDLQVAGDTFAPELPAGTFVCKPWQTSRTGLRYRYCTWLQEGKQ